MYYFTWFKNQFPSLNMVKEPIPVKNNYTSKAFEINFQSQQCTTFISCTSICFTYALLTSIKNLLIICNQITLYFQFNSFRCTPNWASISAQIVLLTNSLWTFEEGRASWVILFLGPFYFWSICTYPLLDTLWGHYSKQTLLLKILILKKNPTS